MVSVVNKPRIAYAFLSLSTIMLALRYRVPSLRALLFSTPLHGDRSVPLFEIGQSPMLGSYAEQLQLNQLDADLKTSVSQSFTIQSIIKCTLVSSLLLCTSWVISKLQYQHSPSFIFTA